MKIKSILKLKKVFNPLNFSEMFVIGVKMYEKYDKDVIEQNTVD